MDEPHLTDESPGWAAPLLARAGRTHAETWGAAPRHAAVVPGRINLIGEHVDLHGGPVLPVALGRGSVLTWGPGDGARLRLRSAARAGVLERDAAGSWRAADVGDDRWGDRVRALVEALQAAGLPALTGDVHVDGDLPLGAGLASSAALGVGLGRLAEVAAGCALPPLDLARAVQAAEHACGTPCGLMDPLAVCLARAGHALHVDCAAETWRHVPLPNDVEFVVVDSGQRHDLTDGSYAARRDHGLQAARALGVTRLADAGHDDLTDLDDGPLRRTARHVVSEVARVGAFERALMAGEAEAAGAILAEGHASLRDDLQVSTHGIDLLAQMLNGPPRDGVVLGARLTGGGFGGCLVVLTRPGGLPCVEERLLAAGLPVSAFAAATVDGALVVRV